MFLMPDESRGRGFTDCEVFMKVMRHEVISRNVKNGFVNPINRTLKKYVNLNAV